MKAVNRRDRRRWLGVVAVMVALGFVVTGCRGSEDEGSKAEARGVTAAPCPKAVNEGNGCIYLGVLSDLTKGPLSALARPLNDAQVAFWDRVNAQGGIEGYDVDIVTYVRDTEYNPEIHNRMYREIRDKVLALAQSVGSPHTMGILPDLKKDNMVAGVTGWSSAWAFEPNVMLAGSNYCFDGMNSVDWAIDEHQAKKVMAVGWAGDYGGDSAVGVEHAAKERGIEFANFETPAGQDNQAGAIAAIVKEDPDLVVFAAGPTELAAVMAGTAERGFDGIFIGLGPTWHHSLLQTPVADVVKERFYHMTPWRPYGSDSPGHKAMREALGNPESPSEGYTIGWTYAYPIYAALKAAAKAHKLTPEGLVETVSNLTDIDFEGMMPASASKMSSDANATAVRESLLSRVDESAPTGTTPLGDFKAGPTVLAYDFTQPCFSLNN